MLSKNKIWRKRVLLVIAALLLITPCAFCWWFLIGNEIVFRARLPIYAGAQEVDHTMEHYGANLNVQSLYFWTADPLEKVQRYYETFTLPFIKSPYLINLDSINFRSVFNPSSKPLPIITDDITHETADAAHDYKCHYQMDTQSCVLVELRDYGQAGQVTLPPPSEDARARSTQPSPSLNLRGGTLIVYAYFVNDW